MVKKNAIVSNANNNNKIALAFASYEIISIPEFKIRRQNHPLTFYSTARLFNFILLLRLFWFDLCMFWCCLYILVEYEN